LRDGKGRIDYMDKSYYEGEFVNDKKHGYGKYFYQKPDNKYIEYDG